MAGMDRYTGAQLSGWAHVVQSIEVIMTTRFGERVMREWFGSNVPNLLGELVNPQTFVRFYGAVSRALTIKELNGIAREPRFKITRFSVLNPSRDGSVQIDIHGLYMPNALQGDYTPEASERVITITPNGIRGVVS